MKRLVVLLLLLLAYQSAPNLAIAGVPQRPANENVSITDLPKEVRSTLASIKKGGPFPYQRDGIVFGNFEKRLPSKERGYYKEYTVPTPGAATRGARRIIAGRRGDYYYTDDHYKTFRRIRE